MIIPAYNEGSVIRQVINSLLNKVSAVIIVDDGSATPLINTVHDLPVVLLRHRVNLGQGAALQTGFEYARRKQADIVITFDADGQHDVTDIPALLAPILNQEADITLGSRFLTKKSTNISITRNLVLQTARFINYLFSGLLLSDAHNGLRAFSKEALEKIAITENGMTHASELLLQIKKHRLRYKEIPVHIHYTDYSKGKGQLNRNSIKILFDLVLHKLFK